MSYQRKRRSKGLTKGIRGAIGVLAFIVAFGFLFFQLISSVLYAFEYSGWVGFRSLAAALFPLSVALYLGFLARMKVPTRESRAPLINNFVIFLFWTMLLLGIDQTSNLVGFPLEELLYSSTIALMVWRHRYREAFGGLLACCYGIISGTLASVIIFGMNPTAL